VERSTHLVHPKPEWSWWLFIRWALLICAVAMIGSGLVAVGFFVVVAIPLAVTLDVAIGAFAFRIPFLAFPVIWVLGMIRCYRRHPSSKLMAALALAGALVFTLLPIAIFFVVLAASGGWSVK
jgi:hypothetical protein